jgi:ABC-type transport system involved in cytochrome bd biosynthesis fused ATPase/permease subunit
MPWISKTYKESLEIGLDQYRAMFNETMKELLLAQKEVRLLNKAAKSKSKLKIALRNTLKQNQELLKVIDHLRERTYNPPVTSGPKTANVELIHQ